MSSLTSRVDEAVKAPSVERIAEGVKRALQESLASGAIALDNRLRQPRPDTYARRLLHRDAANRYTMVVMTWGPGQRTALHDHAGIWCVECVVEGMMEIAQYDLVSEHAGAYSFVERNRVRAGRGSAGCLIPPFEYHTLSNLQDAAPSITLHVYGGEMDHCHVYEPSGDGTYLRLRRDLAYHE
jgi:predicted metal-dependent enzyme (double-stranded beta helix superfamily)